MKTKSKISGYVIRSTAYAVFLSAAFVALSLGFQSPKSQSQPRTFSFAERVAYQRIIEDVYWRHRIWPEENPNPKPSLDAVMSQAQLENKVADYLRDSLALEDYWQRPITAEQLQAEMDRMARDTKQPEVLRELFDALGNDPAAIAECLARPILAARLIADLPPQDQTRHVQSPQTDVLRTMSMATTSGRAVYTRPEIVEAATGPACMDNWGATTTANAPSVRSDHTAVWTGSEMIIWGGWSGSGNLNTGARYNPSTDSWTATGTTNAPTARRSHTAVWTGNEMIVWGGYDALNTGGRYNPITDSWTATATVNAPSARKQHTAIWSGIVMIIWGGHDSNSYVNSGGRYNPANDFWTATSTINAPDGRNDHTAVWSGSEMIVWGGYDGLNNLDTGGRYDPGTDTWTATGTTNTPSGRYSHTAVWTGGEMIVWGGFGHVTNMGGRYDPRTDNWIAITAIKAPTARGDHTTVWTGSDMIVWGGYDVRGESNTGGRYHPSTDSWIATSTNNAPSRRGGHTAVWTGSEMIVWGGVAFRDRTNTGGRYCGQYPPPSPTPPPLTIIQPNGGEFWLMGSVHEIKWDRTNIKHTDHISLHYSRDGGATWFRIAQDIPAFTYGYWWQVDNFPTTQGRVKILLQEDRSITDQSDANFTVKRKPYITLLRPNGGEVWTIGQNQNIHWSRQNPGGNNVDIDYSTDNGTTWIRIATQAEDNGWYLWNVPGPVTTMAKVRIRYHETPSVNDTSEAVFTIVSP